MSKLQKQEQVEVTIQGRQVGQTFSLEKNILKTFPDSSHYKKYDGSYFMPLSEILSKLQICKVTNFMKVSDGLLM